MQLGYLGPVEVRDGGRAVPVPGARLRLLLVELALHAGRWVRADALVEAVWADSAPTDPANSLQSLVSRLRRALGRPGLVEQSAAGYRLTVDPEDVDAVRFARLVAEGRAHVARGDDAAAATALDEALALWRGRPLPDHESPEAATRRALLADLHVGARVERAALALRAGEVADALVDLEQVLTGHPLREDAVGLAMDALVALGRPGEALAVYERTRAALAGELGTDPSPELRARHLDVLRRGEQQPLPPSNLPAAVTSFLGRDADVRAVRDRLGATRLVTVVGAGGAGKTRLAAEVAGAVLSGSPALVPDGVWFVELAPVTDPDAVPTAVLDALGVRDSAVREVRADRAPRPALTRLVERLAPATCLLVVDNCEHLVDAAADLVATLLARCPGVRVLATSREPLGTDGETLHPLSPLAAPPAGTPPEEAGRYAAVRLLLDRGRAVRPDLPLDDSLVEVAGRLDGLPLAIELAAARLRVLGTAELAGRLADRFQLLTGGRRTATPRHRTLRAVVEWSWELLTPAEREVAEHLSVFAGGAGAEAVAAVCPTDLGGGLDDVLHALVDKSILLVEHTPTGARFRMLETLREYAAERLAAGGAAPAAHGAHARYVTGVVQRQDPLLRGAGQLAALHALDAAHDEVLAALRHLEDAGDAAGVLALAVGLGWWWMLRESVEEAHRWLTAALAVPGAAELPEAPVAEVMRAVLGLSVDADQGNAGWLADTSHVRALAERTAALGSPVARVLGPVLLHLAGLPDEGRRATDASLTDPDPWVRASARMVLMTFAENEGDLLAVRAHVEAALTEWHELGDHWGLGSCLAARGNLRVLDGDLDGAAEDYRAAQDHVRALQGTTDEVMVTMRQADLRVRAGDVAGARTLLAQLRTGRAAGAADALRRVLVALTAASIALADGDPDELRAVQTEVEDELNRLGEPFAVFGHGAAIAHAVACELAVRLGQLDRAGEHAAAAHRTAVATGDRPVLAAVAVALGTWQLALGEPVTAARLLGASVRLRGADDPTSCTVAELRSALATELGAGSEVEVGRGRDLDVVAATGLLAEVALAGQARRR